MFQSSSLLKQFVKTAAIALFVVLFALPSRADFAQRLSYQGRLTDSNGVPLADGNYSMTFNIFTVETGGTAVWSETQGAVPVADGLFSAVLGGGTSLSSTDFNSTEYWLEVQIGGTTYTPRQRITAAAMALNVPDSRITSAKVADNSLTAADLNVNVVSSVDGVTNDGGNIDLVAGTGINITPDDALNQITIATVASAIDHGGLTGLGDDDHTQYFNLSQNETVTGIPTFNGGTSGSSAPFLVDSNSLVSLLNADLLDGFEETAFFKLADSETVSGIPAFNGGTSGTSAPFSVDSTYVVSSLNADLLDGYHASDLEAVLDHGELQGLGDDDHTQYLNLSQNETMNGDLTIYESSDAAEAVLNIYGASQGTGRVFVGQGSTYGGGIIYNGDGTPVSNTSTDHISIYRRSAGTDAEVLHWAYNSNTAYFEGNVDFQNNGIVDINWGASDDGAGSGLDADLLDGYDWTNVPNATDIWVNETGDTMTGALTMSTSAANILFDDAGAYIQNSAGSVYINDNVVVGAGAYIDDDTTLGENSDDWIRFNGYIEMKSNTNSYGIVLRDSTSTSYFGITQVGGASYLTDSNTYGNYFLMGDGANATIRGDLTVSGGDIYLPDSSTNLLEGTNDTLRIKTPSGYVDVGPMNTGWSHFSTDRTPGNGANGFYFNTNVTVDGDLKPYTDNSYQLGYDPVWSGASNAWSKVHVEQGMEARWNGNTPYIDFSNDDTSDYDGRIIQTGDDSLEVRGTNLIMNSGDIYSYRIGPKYTSWSGIGDGGAAIVNENSSYQALMIVGNSSADGSTRVVKVWDKLSVQGNIELTGEIQGNKVCRAGTALSTAGGTVYCTAGYCAVGFSPATLRWKNGTTWVESNSGVEREDIVQYLPSGTPYLMCCRCSW